MASVMVVLVVCKGAVLRYHRLRREDLQKPCSTGMPQARERAETIFVNAATQP